MASLRSRAAAALLAISTAAALSANFEDVLHIPGEMQPTDFSLPDGLAITILSATPRSFTVTRQTHPSKPLPIPGFPNDTLHPISNIYTLVLNDTTSLVATLHLPIPANTPLNNIHIAKRLHATNWLLDPTRPSPSIHTIGNISGEYTLLARTNPDPPPDLRRRDADVVLHEAVVALHANISDQCVALIRECVDPTLGTPQATGPGQASAQGVGAATVGVSSSGSGQGDGLGPPRSGGDSGGNGLGPPRTSSPGQDQNHGGPFEIPSVGPRQTVVDFVFTLAAVGVGFLI